MTLVALNVARAGNSDLGVLAQMGNRHGLITGATGTGKTVSLQVLAERFSWIGVPVFMADVKGDLAGISQPGQMTAKLKERLDAMKLPPPAFAGLPVTPWDVFGERGHPLRASVSALGPMLMARMLSLNEVQAGVLHLVFRIADDNGLLLLDLKDLRAMLGFVGDNAQQYTTTYGNVSAASIGAIQRGLLQLEDQGADRFLGEPMLNLDDLMQTDGKGHGVINVLAAEKLLNAPRLYSSFLLWMLSELYEHLPEVGDADKPKFVFFFDEAHLLFSEAPRPLLEKIEQIVRLVRSKGVGVYFVTQNPLDVPDSVLGQLGNRIQHALRAFNVRDQKAVKAAAETMRPNPKINTEKVITELGVGEALVSFLDAKGRPTPVERALIVPPASRIGPLTDAERTALMKTSLVAGTYDQAVDRESAYERLRGHVIDRMGEQPVAAAPSQIEARSPVSPADAQASEPPADARVPAPGASPQPSPSRPRTSSPAPEPAGGGMGGAIREALGGLARGSGRKDSMLESLAKSAARSVGSTLGREIIRGVLGSVLGRKR